MTQVSSRHRQAGITAIGFLFLAAVFGLVGFAGIKLVPMFMKDMQLTSVLEDVKEELDGQGATPGQIRQSIQRRFDIESIRLPTESVKINQSRNGYQVTIQYDNRTPFIANIWFLMTFDKQVEIRR